VSAFVLLFLKIVTVGAAIVFFVCVFTIMGCVLSILIQVARGAKSWGPFAILAHYRAVKTDAESPAAIARTESCMYRARRIAIRAWLVALIAGVFMVVFALVFGET
jgi:hypothetical protein